MAIYSPAVMRRIAQGALWGPWDTSYELHDVFAGGVASKTGHAVPQAYLDTNAGSGWSGASLLMDRTTPRIQRSFDPAAEPTYDTALEDCFEERGGRLHLRFNGWWTVSELESFRASADRALYYAMKAQSGGIYHSQIKVHVAARRLADADVPASWAGAPRPDVKVTYDATQAGNTPAVGDVVLDVTEVLCECPRYRDNGDSWRQRFV